MAAQHMQFTTDELHLLAMRYRQEGFAEGTWATKKAMGQTLDHIVDSTHEGQPYRFPVWESMYDYRPQTMSRPPQPTIPKIIELSKEQLEAIRVLLCGPRPMV